MNMDRHYLEKGVTEVNLIGGPPICAQDMMPQTRKERWQTHWQSNKIVYVRTGYSIIILSAILMVLTVFASFAGAIHRDVAGERNAILRAKFDRDRAIAIIEKMEEDQAPLYAKAMDEEFKVEGRYDAIAMPSMSVHFPRTTIQFDEEVRPLLEKHGWSEGNDMGFSPRGYLLEYYYTFGKIGNNLPSETVWCRIHGHVGMKLAHTCSVVKN